MWGVHLCDVEIKPGTVHAYLIHAFRRAYILPYKMATFIARKGYSIWSIQISNMETTQIGPLTARVRNWPVLYPCDV